TGAPRGRSRGRAARSSGTPVELGGEPVDGGADAVVPPEIGGVAGVRDQGCRDGGDGFEGRRGGPLGGGSVVAHVTHSVLKCPARQGVQDNIRDTIGHLPRKGDAPQANRLPEGRPAGSYLPRRAGPSPRGRRAMQPRKPHVPLFQLEASLLPPEAAEAPRPLLRAVRHRVQEHRAELARLVVRDRVTHHFRSSRSRIARPISHPTITPISAHAIANTTTAVITPPRRRPRRPGRRAAPPPATRAPTPSLGARAGRTAVDATAPRRA